MSTILVYIYFIATLCMIDTAKILGVFPTPSVSHQVVFRVLIQELARRGHEVVTITTDPAFPKGQAPANLTEIDLHDVSYDYVLNMWQDDKNEFEYGKEIPWIMLEKQILDFFNILEVQVKSEAMKKFIEEKRQFDIVLIEAYIRPAIAYSYLFKAPVVLVSSFAATLDNLEIFGAPTHPILYPTPYHQRLFNLSLWEKLREYYYHAQYIMHLQKSIARTDNELAQRMFGPNVPPVSELNKNVDMLFLNVHPIWMNNQPVPPNVVFMGGIHQKPIKELPEDLKSYLDSSTNGVIYVSFGTNVLPPVFPAERFDIITEALSELPFDILFKWNDDVLRKSNNIKFSKWLPQSELLKHPKVKAFVMQGGLQSTDEAITAGVPLVCIPMLGDQWYNAEKYVQLAIGLKLDLFKLTKTELKNAIDTVISNSSYRENIVKLRDRMNDQPQSPLERAVWWVEYVLRHGGAKHLRAPAANMSWAEYYELELVSIVLAGFLVSVTIGLLIFIRFWRYITQFLGKNVKVKQS